LGFALLLLLLLLPLLLLLLLVADRFAAVGLKSQNRPFTHKSFTL
jgi:hypothetical protein